MKKLSLLAVLSTAVVVSTGVFAKFEFDCSKGSTSYGYLYQTYCSACPDNKVRDKTTGDCVVCVNDHDGKAQDLGCSSSKPLCDASQGKAGTACKAPDQVKPCAKNEFFHSSTQKCISCLPNAICDGKDYVCKAGYEKENLKGKVGAVSQCIPSSGKCKANQYMLGKTCIDCPSCAKCNGVDILNINGSYLKDERGAIICGTTCDKKQYLSSDKRHCYTCPANATCNGKTATCNKGMTQTVRDGKVFCASAPTCKASQYLVNNKCTACPANATCNGKTATCKKGMKQTVKDGKVTCAAVKKCKKGSHEGVAWIKTHYKNCSKCGTENVKTCSKNKKAHKHYYCECDC